jgi:death-on-curing protein
VTIWLDRLVIEAIHAEQLERHGGGTGIRDPGLLESALARPLNRAGYGEPDIAELAAVYALGIAKNHPFVDGNKRTAYVALETFIILNGVTFPVSDAEAVVAMIDMASGAMTDDEFITWVREHARD